MADAPEAFQEALTEATNAAWDHDWDRAIAAYKQALDIVPQEPNAVAGLGLAYLEARRLEDALDSYRELSSLASKDPIPVEKMAEIQELLGQRREAAENYMVAADLHVGRKNLERAMANWERAARLSPTMIQAHMRLAWVYEKANAPRRAVQEYVTLAGLFQRAGEMQKAEQAIRRATDLDPTDMQVRNMVAALRKGEPIDLPAVAEAEVTTMGMRMPPKLLQAIEEPAEEEKRMTPIQEAAEQAMGVLADFIFEGQLSPDAQTAIVQAIDWHRTGDAQPALAAYERAVSAGVSHPALNMNLGILYQEVGDSKKALKVLARVVGTRDYALAGHLVIGHAQLSLDKPDEAVNHLIQALQAADGMLSEHVDTAGYEELAAALRQEPADKQASSSQALLHFLDVPGWRKQFGDVLRRFGERGRPEYVSDLMEVIEEQEQPEVSEIMQHVDEFISREMYGLAMDEAHYAVERSPGYLPAHARMAEILARQGRFQDAATKFSIIGDTYLVRGNEERAVDMLVEVLQISPMDVNTRRRVVDMLREQERASEALQQYRELADTFSALADNAAAQETLNEALEYARDIQAEPEQMADLLRDLADKYKQRLELQRALAIYREIMMILPADEQAVFGAVDTSFRLNEPEGALAALDDYLRYCVEHGSQERVVGLLEEQVRTYPDEWVLRQRLADVYHQQGRISDAVAQLDTLGELQLGAGLKDEALGTIHKIIDMNPPEIEDYRRLLKELGEQ
jgi:tetratricopeptide (TPR) repeat protein